MHVSLRSLFLVCTVALMSMLLPTAGWAEEEPEPVDIDPPFSMLLVDPSWPDGGYGWYRKSPSLSFYTSEPAATGFQWDSSAGSWNMYTGAFLAPSGRHTLYYRSVDEAGNTEDVQSREIRVDPTGPTASLYTPTSLIKTPDHWTPGKVNLSWSAVDQVIGSGVSHYHVQFSVNSTSNWRNLRMTSSRTGNYMAWPNRRYYFRVRAMDRAGNYGNWSPLRSVAVKGLGGHVFPIPGRHNFVDTWGAARSGGRRHQGTDIFAKRGQPVIAVITGRATRRWGTLGGRSVWLRGNDGKCYYYAHLNSYGKQGYVTKGTIIGYVGNTGNARTTPPHLHFEIRPGCGSPMNPYRYLRIWDRYS